MLVRSNTRARGFAIGLGRTLHPPPLGLPAMLPGMPGDDGLADMHRLLSRRTISRGPTTPHSVGWAVARRILPWGLSRSRSPTYGREPHPTCVQVSAGPVGRPCTGVARQALQRAPGFPTRDSDRSSASRRPYTASPRIQSGGLDRTRRRRHPSLEARHCRAAPAATYRRASDTLASWTPPTISSGVHGGQAPLRGQTSSVGGRCGHDRNDVIQLRPGALTRRRPSGGRGHFARGRPLSSLGRRATPRPYQQRRAGRSRGGTTQEETK